MDMRTACEVDGASGKSFKDMYKDDCRPELSRAPAGVESHSPKRNLLVEILSSPRWSLLILIIPASPDVGLCQGCRAVIFSVYVQYNMNTVWI